LSHRQQIREEFSRQADAMAQAPAFSADGMANRFKEAIASKAGGLLLDLACGPGILLEQLASTMSLAAGVDVTPKMLELTRARCLAAGLTTVRVIESIAEQLPFATASFDCVATRLSVHHFPEPQRVLREVARILRSDGVLVLADLVSSNDAAESGLHNALEQLRDPSHVRMRSERELLELVHDAGFRIVSTERWLQRRRFDEWAAIVENARSLRSLETVMRHLGEAGSSAGINLRVANDGVEFDHRWICVVAVPALRGSESQANDVRAVLEDAP
jgi:ubiquinone/menaquinone biosynthesis C-methylase UbiE